jgi:hypothetical protein
LAPIGGIRLVQQGMPPFPPIAGLVLTAGHYSTPGSHIASNLLNKSLAGPLLEVRNLREGSLQLSTILPEVPNLQESLREEDFPETHRLATT